MLIFASTKSMLHYISLCLHARSPPVIPPLQIPGSVVRLQSHPSRCIGNRIEVVYRLADEVSTVEPSPSISPDILPSHLVAEITEKAVEGG